MDNKKKEKAGASNLFFYVALALLIVSLLVFALNLTRIMRPTGYASSTGSANLTVETRTLINFTTTNVTWGSGAVTYGETNAVLDSSLGTVLRGNWTAVKGGLILVNIGNVNVSISLSAARDNATMFGGTNPGYQINISNAEPRSCNNSGDIDLGFWYDANASLMACDILFFNDSMDSMRIDFRLTIPNDATRTGAIGDVITATATAT